MNLNLHLNNMLLFSITGTDYRDGVRHTDWHHNEDRDLPWWRELGPAQRRPASDTGTVNGEPELANTVLYRTSTLKLFCYIYRKIFSNDKSTSIGKIINHGTQQERYSLTSLQESIMFDIGSQNF